MITQASKTRGTDTYMCNGPRHTQGGCVDHVVHVHTSGTQLKVTVPLAGKEVHTQEATGSGQGLLSSIEANLQVKEYT